MKDLEGELSRITREGMLRRRRTLEGPQGAHVKVDGREVLSFCSNDYLGLANHPDLIEAACEGARRFGVGSGASHLLCGHSAAHSEFENDLAAFLDLPAALLFSTGYMANIGAVTALLGRSDDLFCDKLNHASLNDAAILSRANLYRYPHLDMDALSSRLSRSKARRKLVVSDSVFSMDGDIAPVGELLDICERFDAWLLLDDAHGFGVLGENGRGALSHFDVSSPRIVYVGTLGKAAGVSGAFVAGSRVFVDILIQKARTYIYTTAQPPLLAQVLRTSLELIAAEDWRRKRLKELIAYLKAAFPRLHSDTPIQPYIVGENEACLSLSEKLKDAGLLVPAIRPPTVPKHSARLRISLSAAHTFEDLSLLIEALRKYEAPR